MLLGLDLGTTNVKAVVADEAGRPLGAGSAPVQLYHVGEGGVEQDLEAIWSATLSVIRQAVSDINPLAIRAIGVSSQGGALQLLNERFQPLGRVVSWLDARGRAEDERLTDELGRGWFRDRIGHEGSGLAIGQWLRLRREAPAQVQPPNRLGFVGDTIVQRLCGRAAHDGTSCGLTLLYNPKLRTVDPELCLRLGLQPGQLPDLISPRAPAGGLLPAVAQTLRLTAGIPVSAAIHDQYAAALGVGAVHPGDVLFGGGTAWVLLAVSDRLSAPVMDGAFVCNHVIEGCYGQILSLYNGGSALAWALKLLGLAGQPGAEIERLIAAANPGSDGLQCWPFLASVGAPGLAPDLRGQFSGLQFAHGPAQVLRAVVEGLAFELNRHLAFLVEAKLPVEKLLLCGGAAASRVTPQIIADVTGLPIACLPGSEGSLLGAVIIARGLLEPDRPLEDLVAEIAPSSQLIHPGPDSAFYRGCYEQYRCSLLRPPGRRAAVTKSV